MVWLAVGKDGKEGIYTSKPIRGINILTNKESGYLPIYMLVMHLYQKVLLKDL